MVTVIIPSYNRAYTIRKSIESVLNQTYTDLELIVVDDGSTDNTKEVVEGIEDSRVRYIQSEKNVGACEARNIGIRAAKGDIIAFQDSDDEWVPQKLERQLEIINAGKADVVFCQKERRKLDGTFIDITAKKLEEGIVPYEFLTRKSRVSTQTILAKREVFEDCLFDPVVKKAQDFDWVIRAGVKHTFWLVKEVLVIQYYHEDCITVKDVKKDVASWTYFCEKYNYLYDSLPQLQINLLLRLAEHKKKQNQNCYKEYRKLWKVTHKKEYLKKYVKWLIGGKIYIKRNQKTNDDSDCYYT